VSGGIPTIAAIKRAVADGFNVDLAVLSEPTGSTGAMLRDNVRPRQVAMAMSLAMTRHSETRVGQFFGGRHHTTVLHARRAVNAFLLADPKARDATREALKLLRMEG
jgi:chromosomal replication initiator protein